MKTNAALSFLKEEESDQLLQAHTKAKNEEPLLMSKTINETPTMRSKQKHDTRL
jgi:hypothetical protein